MSGPDGPASLLVVAAHPDDEVLGCGGLIARTLREGGRVDVLVLTEGATTQYPDRPDLVARKQAEARAAMDALGGARITLLGLADMRLATLAPADVNAPVADAVAERRPGWVLAPSADDLNADHRVAHEAARVACRPTGDHTPWLLSYEVLSSTEWGRAPFAPNLYVPLGAADLECKVAGLAAYGTEVRAWPHPRSPEGVRHLAAVRGAQAGVAAAEAFRLEWGTR